MPARELSLEHKGLKGLKKIKQIVALSRLCKIKYRGLAAAWLRQNLLICVSSCSGQVYMVGKTNKTKQTKVIYIFQPLFCTKQILSSEDRISLRKWSILYSSLGDVALMSNGSGFNTNIFILWLQQGSFLWSHFTL